VRHYTSWGGYEVTLTVARSAKFAAAVASAANVELVSSSLSISKLSGSPGYLEATDNPGTEVHGRMEVPFWEDPGAYRRNSPLEHVLDIGTPLLLGVGEQDQKVTPEQPMSLFLALRRMGKPVILVKYPDRGHGFAMNADYNRRVRHFSDHYLRDRPADAWLRDGFE
jgi:dipeptidyl aminopeptidase/acylaminoacyl peptidase